MMPIDLTIDDDEDTLRRQQRQTRRVVPASLALDWSASSSIGLRRNENQDAWGECGGDRFVVADGVGGILGGALASTLAVTHFLAADPADDWSPVLRRIDRIVQRECSNRDQAGAATTLVGLHVVGTTATVSHVGDSRAYLLRDESLLCLTQDHNVANLRRSEGSDPNVADRRGKPRSLTSYLGAADPNLLVGVLTFSLKPADRLLLCTDGVHEQIAANALAEVLGAKRAAATTATALVEMADATGGRDNATALVVQVEP